MLLKIGVINKVALTLFENQSQSNSEWLLKLHNDTTGIDYVIILQDLSNFQKRANIFFIQKIDTDQLPEGQYTYTVYEMAPTSPRTTNTSLAIKSVEIDRCLVIGTDEIIPVFKASNIKESPVFKG